MHVSAAAAGKRPVKAIDKAIKSFLLVGPATIPPNRMAVTASTMEYRYTDTLAAPKQRVPV
jgi:hypothetical protein